MRLSTKTRYGVRAVFDIAYHCGEGSGQVKDIARRQNISPRYLEQIFHRLKKSGIVKSERGPKGGYALTRSSTKITVGDIYRAAEGLFNLAPCKKKSKKCEQIEDCVAYPVWENITKEVEKIFDNVSIEDLCKIASKMKVPREVEKKYMYFI
jgi:Rrf2 family iron-sulfur cluster assembly transcriptional regulator